MLGTDRTASTWEATSGIATKSVPSRTAVAVTMGLLAICLLVVQARDLLSFSQWYTDEDQTLLWLAGQDLVHLQMHSPGFPGQNYFTVFEALPGALFHLTGMTLRVASPLGAALIVTVCWVGIAAAAYQRGYYVSAILALAVPVCLSLQYTLLFDQLRGELTGDLFGALAVAASVAIRRPLPRLAAVIALGGVGFVWDFASVVAVAPALAAVVAGDSRILCQQRSRTLVVGACALAIPVCLAAAIHLWYASHPHYLLAPSVPLTLKLRVLWINLTHPARLFGFYAPQLARAPWLVLVLLAGLVTAALAISWKSRRIEPAVAALVFLVMLLLVLSDGDTGWNFEPDLYLSGSRFLLMMPIGSWVVIHYTLRAYDSRMWAVQERWHVTAGAALAVIAIVSVASTASAQVNFRPQLKSLIAWSRGDEAGVTVADSAPLLTECQTVTRVYHEVSAQILVTFQRAFAYGCEAQSGLATLYPPYDRREWVLNAAQTQPTRRLLLQGWNCMPAPASVGTCRPVADGMYLLTTPRRPAGISLAQLGVYVRRGD